jgi:hypothetical protein
LISREKNFKGEYLEARQHENSKRPPLRSPSQGKNKESFFWNHSACFYMFKFSSILQEKFKMSMKFLDRNNLILANNRSWLLPNTNQ